MRQKKDDQYKLNESVRFPEVRIISEGYNGVIVSSYEASKIAMGVGKDLILINENATPPIVVIEEYSKFLYNIKQKKKEAKKNSKKVEIKEIKLSVSIADHDLGIKAKSAYKFLSDGNKVKCTLLMKGRENSMKSQGEIVMLKFAKLVEEIGVPEFLPQLLGKKWQMSINPKK